MEQSEGIEHDQAVSSKSHKSTQSCLVGAISLIRYLDRHAIYVQVRGEVYDTHKHL